jgi:hypothetical protein
MYGIFYLATDTREEIFQIVFYGQLIAVNHKFGAGLYTGTFIN